MGTPVSALGGGVGSERWAQGVEVSLLVLSCPCPPGWHGVLCPLRSPEPTPLLPPFPEATSLRVPGSSETPGFSVVPALWEAAVTGAGVGRTVGSGRASGLPSPLTHSAASVDFSIASPLGFLLPALPSPSSYLLLLLLRGWGGLVGEGILHLVWSRRGSWEGSEPRAPQLSPVGWKVRTPPHLASFAPSCQAQHGPVLLHCIPLVPQPRPTQPGVGRRHLRGGQGSPVGPWDRGGVQPALMAPRDRALGNWSRR